MSAPALTAEQVAAAAPLEPRPERQAAWERYLPAVDALCPGGSDQERRDRAGLMLLRDRTNAAAREASWEAQQLLLAIEHIATVHAAGNLRGEALTETRLALIRAGIAARKLEDVFSDGRGAP